MRKRKIIRDQQKDTRLVKILFGVAGAVFILTAVLYGVKLFIYKFSPPQVISASPYIKQNQFGGVETKLKELGMEAESRKLISSKTILVIKIKEGPEVLFTNDQDIDWQISSLHSIIYKLTIENKQPKQVDFRFGKPIVKF
jgi:hypothetical protein